MKTHVVTGLLIGVLSLMVAGCSEYYRVTDPGSGRVYYTTDIEERIGGIKFKDDRTKSTVILHSAEMSEISEDEYGSEVKETSPIVIQPAVATGQSAKTESFR